MWHGWRIWREQRCLLIIFFTSLATNKGQNCFLFCMILVLKAQISGSVPLCSGITQLLNVQSNSLWKSAQRNNIDCGLHEGSRIRGGSRKIVRNIKVMWPLCLNMQNMIAGSCVWSESSSGREHEMAVPDRARERHREARRGQAAPASRARLLTGPSTASRKMGAESRSKLVTLLPHWNIWLLSQEFSPPLPSFSLSFRFAMVTHGFVQLTLGVFLALSVSHWLGSSGIWSFMNGYQCCKWLPWVTWQTINGITIVKKFLFFSFFWLLW